MLEAVIAHGPWVAAAVSLAVTPVGYAVIAMSLERRLLRRQTEFIALTCGDPLLALSIALGAWMLHGTSPSGIAGPPFDLAIPVGWFGFGIFQWRAEVREGFYSLAQAVAPTKIWHQLVVYPALGYLTWTACLGGLLAPGDDVGNILRVMAKGGIVACVVAWMVANAYDRKHPKLGHPPYNWRRLRPQPRPWSSQSTSLRGYLSGSSV